MPLSSLSSKARLRGRHLLDVGDVPNDPGLLTAPRLMCSRGHCSTTRAAGVGGLARKIAFASRLVPCTSLHRSNVPVYRAAILTVHKDTGANASAEEADEALEDAAVKVNNIVHSFRLQSTSFDKKGYLAYLKGMVTSPISGHRLPSRADRIPRTALTDRLCCASKAT